MSDFSITRKKAERILEEAKQLKKNIASDIAKRSVKMSDGAFKHLTSTISAMQVIYRGGLLRSTEGYHEILMSVKNSEIFNFLRDHCIASNASPINEDHDFMIRISREAWSYCALTIVESPDSDVDDAVIVNSFIIKSDTDIGLIKLLVYDMFADLRHRIIEDPNIDKYFIPESDEEEEDEEPTVIHVYMDKVSAESIAEGYDMIYTFNELQDAIKNDVPAIHTTQYIAVAAMPGIDKYDAVTLHSGGIEMCFSPESFRYFVKCNYVTVGEIKEEFMNRGVLLPGYNKVYDRIVPLKEGKLMNGNIAELIKSHPELQEAAEFKRANDEAMEGSVLEHKEAMEAYAMKKLDEWKIEMK